MTCSNRNLEIHTQSLADYLPNGALFEAKNIRDSNFRQLLRGLAGEIFTAQGYLCTLNNDYFPDRTTLFLSEWESALGIPDDCFSGTGSIDERRRDILVKLSALGVQTAEDFEELALLFGVVVDVGPSSDALNNPPLDVPFTPGGTIGSPYTIVVTGANIVSSIPPLDVPFIPGNLLSIIECLFTQQIPANCNVVFVNE